MTRWIGGDGARPRIDFPATTSAAFSTPDNINFSSLTSLSLGAAHSTRSLIAIGIARYTSISGVITGLSVTVNGVTATTATAQVQSIFAPTLGLHCFLAHVRSPTGTSGNVSLSYTGGGSFSGYKGEVCIYRCRFVRDLNALDTQASASNSATPISVTLNVSKSSSIVAGIGISTTTPPSVSWGASGISLESLTLGFFVGTNYSGALGKQENVAANASYGVTMTPSPAGNRMMLACAFR